MKRIFITLSLIGYTSVFGQIKTNNSILERTVNGYTPFLDASSSQQWNSSTNNGKGLVFPRTDLTKLREIKGPSRVGSSNAPTYYDGMVVYNTVAGTSAIGNVKVKPGFYYYENKSKTLNGGTWKALAENVTGAKGADGKTILNGTTAPAPNTGKEGDFYIDTAANKIYGPKTSNGWGDAVSMVGPKGADGKSMLSGTGNPGASLGSTGDTYIDTNTGDIWSKSTGTWVKSNDKLNGTNLYTANGALTSHRTVDMNGKNLNFSNEGTFTRTKGEVNTDYYRKTELDAGSLELTRKATSSNTAIGYIDYKGDPSADYEIRTIAKDYTKDDDSNNHVIGRRYSIESKSENSFRLDLDEMRTTFTNTYIDYIFGEKGFTFYPKKTIKENVVANDVYYESLNKTGSGGSNNTSKVQWSLNRFVDDAEGAWNSTTERLQRTVDNTKMGFIDFGIAGDSKNSSKYNGLGFGFGNTVHATLREGGNFGIGTQTPTEKLDVAGSIKSTALAESGGGNRPVYADASGKLVIGSASMSGNFYGSNGILTSNRNVNLAEYDLTFTSNNNSKKGKVGIGTNRPVSKLHVESDDDTQYAAFFTRNPNAGVNVVHGKEQGIGIFNNALGNYLISRSPVANAKPFIFDVRTEENLTSPTSGSLYYNFKIQNKEVASLSNEGLKLKSLAEENGGKRPVYADSDGKLVIGTAVSGSGSDHLYTTDGRVKNSLIVGEDSKQGSLEVKGTAKVKTLPPGSNTDKVVVADGEGNLKQRSLSELKRANLRIVTGSTTLNSNDEGGYVYVNSTSAVTVTVPISLPAGFSCVIVQKGTGQVSVAGSGVTLETAKGKKTRAKHSAIGVIKDTVSSATITGDAVM